MGWAYYQKGDYPKAYLFLKRALEFYKDPIIYDHLADTVLKMDDRNSAVYYWEKSLEMEPLQGNVSRKLEALKKTLPAPEVNQTP
jgi:tetratricopeptide (TPR) repeat protein